MGRVVHAWVAAEDEVLILCYQIHATHDNEQHLDIKHLHLHLLITGKNIYPVSLLPLFIFAYCFSTLTQVNLDPSFLTFPILLYVATYKLYLLAFSTQHNYTGNTLAWKKQRIVLNKKELQVHLCWSWEWNYRSQGIGPLLLVQW